MSLLLKKEKGKEKKQRIKKEKEGRTDGRISIDKNDGKMLLSGWLTSIYGSHATKAKHLLKAPRSFMYRWTRRRNMA